MLSGSPPYVYIYVYIYIYIYYLIGSPTHTHIYIYIYFKPHNASTQLSQQQQQLNWDLSGFFSKIGMIGVP